ncbi:hypothetical protein RhiirB3_457835 [Rhizophagus irregularis]|nr:hypothetical protein RhiirB3_457835 [Rhizophagus irregularis]
MDEDSRINPSSSRAIQAEVMEEGEDFLAGWKEPSVYKDCTEGGKTSSSSLSIKGGEKVEEARCLMADFLDNAGILRAQPGQGL